MDNESEYKVGYRRPPQHTRFKKGQSGNPAGHPKTAKRFDSVLSTELDALISVTIDGKPREVSKREALVRHSFAKAAHGDVRALEMFLKRMRKMDAAHPQPPYIIEYVPSNMRDANGELIINRLARLRREHQVASTAGSSQAINSEPVSSDGTDDSRLQVKQALGRAREPDARPTHLRHLKMRAPGPYKHYCMSGTDGRVGRYSSNAECMIFDVHPDDVERLQRQKCSIANEQS